MPTRTPWDTKPGCRQPTPISLVLVKVTSADGMRQDMYGVMLEKPDSIQRDDRTTRHSGACSRIDDLIISYGDQTVDISDSCRDTLTLPSEVRQITVTATAVDGGKARVVPPDADTNQPGHQVNLRPSRPGAGPAMSVFTVVVSHTAGRYTSINYYSVLISVSPPTETDATLEALGVLGAEMSPSFVFDLLDYTASVDHDIATATIRVITNQPDATVSYEPLDADDTTDDYQRPLADGDNTVTITVTAPNASTTQDYTLTINRAESPSTDATLKDLIVPDVTLSPEFQTAVKTYSATVNSGVTVITLEPKTDDGATIEADPPDANTDAEGIQIPLDVRTNSVTITVTAEDRVTTEIYNLTVSRNSLEMESAPLASLAVEGARLFPAFDSEALAYTAFVAHDQGRVTVTAAAQNQGGMVSVDQTDQNATTTGYQLDLVEGRNTIKVTVTASGATTTREYALTVFRAPAPASTTGFLQVDAGWINYCGLRVDHTLDCGLWWGGGTYAYAGWESITGNVPKGVFDRVSVKRYVGCGLRSDDSQHCWGNLISAGDGRRTGLKVDDFSMSAEYGADICVLIENGDIECGSAKRVVKGPFKAIGQTRWGACAIRSDDKVRCWSYKKSREGRVSFGPLELPDEYLDTAFKFISGGYRDACGIRESDGALLCWRWKTDFASGAAIEVIPLETGNPPSGEFTFVDAGLGTACGVRADGTVDCWDTETGALLHSMSSPTGEVDIGYHTVTIDAGMACGLRKDNQVRCWDRGSGNFNTSLSNDSPWRDNAQLLDIDIGENSLSPTFDSDVFTHTATVANYDESVTLKPALTNSLAYYAIYSETGGAAGDDGVVKLIEGENEIRVHVISADRTASSTYTLIVTREGPDPALTLSAEPELIAEGETATITVAITTKTLFQVDQSIDLAVTGTATSSDYNLLPSLTLPAGAKTATATLTAVSDSEDEEGNETVIVTATHAGQFIGSTTVTIRDEGRDTKDAGAGDTEWKVEFNRERIVEGDNASFTVSFTGGESVSEPQTIKLAVSGQATGTDYTISKTTLRLKPGQSSAAANVYTIDDELVEEDETLVITASRGDEVIGFDVMTIPSNDAPAWAVSGEPSEIAEGASSTVTVSVSNGKTFATDQSVSLAVTGTASSSDYTLTATELTLAAGASSVTAAVTANDDTTEESDETVIVTASYDGQAIGSTTVTILANDTPLSTDATLSSLVLSSIDMGTFDSGTSTYSASVGHDVLTTTVTAEAGDDGAGVTIADADGSTQGTSRTVSLSSGDNEITVTVLSEGGTTTRVYTVTVTRAELDAVWGERLPDRDIEVGSGTQPSGLWSDGATMWVITDPITGRISAYSLADGAEQAERGITLAGGVAFASALWSDGAILWVADLIAGRVHAYNQSRRYSAGRPRPRLRHTLKRRQQPAKAVCGPMAPPCG